MHREKDPMHAEGHQHRLQRGMHSSPFVSPLQGQVANQPGRCREHHKHDRDDLRRQLVLVRHVRTPILKERRCHLIRSEGGSGRGGVQITPHNQEAITFVFRVFRTSLSADVAQDLDVLPSTAHFLSLSPTRRSA